MGLEPTTQALWRLYVSTLVLPAASRLRRDPSRIESRYVQGDTEGNSMTNKLNIEAQSASI